MSSQIVNKQPNPGATVRIVGSALLAAAVTFVLLILVPPAAGALGLVMCGLCVRQFHRRAVSHSVLALTVGVLVMVLVYLALAIVSYQEGAPGSGSGGTALPTLVVPSR